MDKDSKYSKEELDWMKSAGISTEEVEGWKANRKGVRLISIRPYEIEEDDEEEDIVRLFVQPLSRKEMQLLATSKNPATSEKRMVNYSVLGGDTDRLEEGPVFTELAQQLEAINKAKSVEVKNC